MMYRIRIHIRIIIWQHRQRPHHRPWAWLAHVPVQRLAPAQVQALARAVEVSLVIIIINWIPYSLNVYPNILSLRFFFSLAHSHIPNIAQTNYIVQIRLYKLKYNMKYGADFYLTYFGCCDGVCLYNYLVSHELVSAYSLFYCFRCILKPVIVFCFIVSVYLFIFPVFCWLFFIILLIMCFYSASQAIDSIIFSIFVLCYDVVLHVNAIVSHLAYKVIFFFVYNVKLDSVDFRFNSMRYFVVFFLMTLFLFASIFEVHVVVSDDLLGNPYCWCYAFVCLQQSL